MTGLTVNPTFGTPPAAGAANVFSVPPPLMSPAGGWYHSEMNRILAAPVPARLPTVTQQQGPSFTSQLSDASMALSIAGTGMQFLGAYYGAKQQQHELKSQALAAEFEATMSSINARLAESDANAILAAGRDEANRSAMQYQQLKSATKVSSAAHGVQAGVGSAAEVQASIELAKQVDALTINKNTVRAAGNARIQARNQRNQSALSLVSAGNLRSTAGSISPFAAGTGSLLSGLGSLGRQYAADRRFDSRSR